VDASGGSSNSATCARTRGRLDRDEQILTLQVPLSLVIVDRTTHTIVFKFQIVVQ
jgi:hypothetical protein